MRSLGDLQRDPDQPQPAAKQSSLPLDVQRERTFDTPEFAGMRFLEVEAKSALNRVHGMPFKWSINPYRGCSHACTFCAAGETPILMADGRTKPLADVRVGDEVYGTIRAGGYRRYVTTPVYDHWSTVKLAYRVRLRDGTVLVASGDHRFLTNRGWKHVTNPGRGVHRTPLTLDDKLIGTGGFAASPKDTPDYRRGYLSGMIRGGGAVYEQFRLALADREALQRTASFLSHCGMPLRHFVFQPERSVCRPIDAIEVSGRANVERIIELIEWPLHATEDWSKGFLAGIFDAEGGYNDGVLRIFNGDREILSWIECCLRRVDVPFVREPSRPGGRVAVRIPGGLRQHLRFFHTVDPAITRKRAIDHMALQSDAPLQVEALEPLGVEIPMYDITTGTGDFIAGGVVSHNCFARPSHAYLNLSPAEDFETTIVVKTNVGEVLRREVAKRSWRGEHVAMGTNTDPYQRAEGRYRLMPGIIDALAEGRTPFSILTKGTLITRDVDRLAAAAGQVDVSAALTVATLDEDLWRSAEPGTPNPKARLEAVRQLNDAGVPTGVMIAPIMPGLSDDRDALDALVAACVEAGATHITPIALHLRTTRPNSPTGASVRDVFWPWLTATRPDLEARYRELYADGAYADASWREAVTSFVAERREAHWRTRGRPGQPRSLRPSPPQPSHREPSGEQPSLFES